jgi:hypothetical protein
MFQHLLYPARFVRSLTSNVTTSSVMLLVASLCAVASIPPSDATAGVVYFDDFESYKLPYLDNENNRWDWLDGNGSWIDSGAVFKWLVTDAYYVEHYGNYALRGNPTNPSPDTDFAILHVQNPMGFAGLKVSLVYLLQLFETAQIAISPDNVVWTDVTSEFALVSNASNSLTWGASADLSSAAIAAGIQDDLFVRFTAWNPSSSSVYHWFGIDNVKVEASQAIPEPASILTWLGLGTLALGVHRSRRKSRP